MLEFMVILLDLMDNMEKKKRNDYIDVNLMDNPNLIPFIFDTSGDIGSEVLIFISK